MRKTCSWKGLNVESELQVGREGSSPYSTPVQLFETHSDLPSAHFLT